MRVSNVARIQQEFARERISDIASHVMRVLNDAGMEHVFTKGERIAVAVGSRGIANIADIVRTVIGKLKEQGVQPFIVPAMGSHGGATAEGQVAVLDSLGVTEARCGVPIVSSMEAVEVGKTENGATVFIDKNASEADGIVVINRVKPHTKLKADNESGLMKMVAAGLGKQKGCSQLHSFGLYPSMVQAARIMLAKAPIRLGIGILENAYDQTAKIVAVRNEDFETADAELLKLAKQLMPTFPIPAFDVLVVKEMGKNISGTGMDVNIIGRVSVPIMNDQDTPQITRIVAMNLTEASHGNALGIGLVDVIPRHLADQIDFSATYANVISAGVLDRGKLPVVVDNDHTAINVALKSLENVDPSHAKIIFIKNTLDLSSMMVSQSVCEAIRHLPGIRVLQEDVELHFNSEGNIPEAWWG
jgi:Lactate racemase N-terminal domain